MTNFNKSRLIAFSMIVLLFVTYIGIPQVNASDSNDLSEISTTEILQSKNMEKAFLIYDKAIESLEFHQLGSENWTGASIEDVRESLVTDVEPYEVQIEGALDFRILLYPFGESTLDHVELGFLFAENHLVFAGLGNLIISLDGEKQMAPEIAEMLSQEGTTLSNIANEHPFIKAFGHVSFEGKGRDMIAIDSGTGTVEGETYFYFIEEGLVKAFETMDLFSAMQGTQTIMFDKLAFHYVNGEIGPASNSTLDDQGVALKVETDLEVDPLSTFMTETSVTNPKFVEAWHGYQQALSELTFRDLGSEELLGSKIEEVTLNLDVGIEARRVDFRELPEFPNSPLSLLVYTYEDTEINPLTGQPDVGEFALYFVDELLAYASVANRSFIIDDDRVLSERSVFETVTKQAPLAELVSLNPQVVAMAYMYQNEEPRSLVAVQSKSETNSRQVSFFFIREGLIRGEETYSLEEVLQDIQTNMFHSLGDFFVNEAKSLDE